MKSFLFGITLLISSLSVSAQTNNYEARASAIAKETTQQLRLQEFTYIKLKKLVENKLREIDAAAAKFSDDAVMYQEAIQDIEKQYEVEILALIPKGTIPLYLKLKPSLALSNESITSKK